MRLFVASDRRLARHLTSCESWRALSVPPFSAVFFEDRFVLPDEAKIALSDVGYLRGEGVFATLRGYDGKCFRKDRHFALLVRGAGAFGMKLPLALERLSEVVDEAAARTKVAAAYVRVTLTRTSAVDEN